MKKNSSLKDENPASSSSVSSKRELEPDDHEAKKEEETSTEPSKKICPSTEHKPIILKGFFAERQGERDSMQDRHILIDDFTKCLKKQPTEMYELIIYLLLKTKIKS